MQHAGPPPRTERQAPCNRSVRQGSGVEEAEARGGLAEGELGEVLQGIRGDAGDGNVVSIPGAGVDSGRQ